VPIVSDTLISSYLHSTNKYYVDVVFCTEFSCFALAHVSPISKVIDSNKCGSNTCFRHATREIW